MDSDGDTRRKTKQTNKQNRRKVTKQNNKQNFTKQETKTNACGTGRGAGMARGKCAPYIDRARSQNLPKMTHFFMIFFVLTRGGNESRVSE